MSLIEILDFPFRSRQRKALRDRSSVSRDSFAAAIAEDGFEREAAFHLWDILVAESLIDNFRPLPDDDFHYMYGLAEEDLDEDVIMRLLSEFKLPLPSPKLVERIGPINSPRLLMSLIREIQSEAKESKD